MPWWQSCLVGWKRVPGVLWNTLENLGRVVFHEMSRSSSNFWNLLNDFWCSSGYLHSLPSKLSSWKECQIILWDRYSYERGIRPPVSLRTRAHTPKSPEHAHSQGLVHHLHLLSTNQAGWGRNSICTSVFDTLIYFSWSPTIHVFLYHGFRSNIKLSVWQHHLETRSGSDCSCMGHRCTRNYLLTLIAALERQHLHYVLF